MTQDGSALWPTHPLAWLRHERFGWSDEVGPDRGAVWQESYRLNAGRLMSKEFVERRDGSFYLIGSRVPLAHIVREFQRGESPILGRWMRHGGFYPDRKLRLFRRGAAR